MLAANFPFLTDQEFSIACQSFVKEVENQDIENEWVALDFVEGHENVYLKIIRLLRRIGLASISDECDMKQRYCSEDDDDEVAPSRDCRRQSSFQVSAEYHICLSATYRVPVLYFFLKNLPRSVKPTVDTVYEWLVPEVLRLQMECVGVMGGISYSEHPVTGIPAFFIHPCNTANTMCELARSTSLGLERYLQVWLGFVGGSVGLVMPMIRRLESNMGKNKREREDMHLRPCERLTT